jgi:hypothetical protein
MRFTNEAYNRKAIKADCLKVLDQVRDSGEGLLITGDDGTPLVTLLPADSAEDEIFGFLKGKAKIVGDVINTIPIEDWDLGDSRNSNKTKGPTPRRPR